MKNNNAYVSLILTILLACFLGCGGGGGGSSTKVYSFPASGCQILALDDDGTIGIECDGGNDFLINGNGEIQNPSEDGFVRIQHLKDGVVYGLQADGRVLVRRKNGELLTPIGEASHVDTVSADGKVAIASNVTLEDILKGSGGKKFFILKNGELDSEISMPSPYTAYGVVDENYFVGNFGFGERGFKYRNGSFSDIPLTTSFQSGPFIDSNGDIAASYFIASSPNYKVTSEIQTTEGNTINLNELAGNSTLVNIELVNGSGTYVGRYSTKSVSDLGATDRWFAYSKDKGFVDLTDILESTFNIDTSGLYPAAVNNNDQIVFQAFQGKEAYLIAF